MKRILVHGGGRMGRQLTEVAAGKGISVEAVVSRTRPEWLGSEPFFDTLEALDSAPDALIDFSLPGGPSVAARWCRSRLCAIVSGTTGMSDGDRDALKSAAELVPVLWAPNLAKGPNIVYRAVFETAQAMGSSASVTVTDIHHVHKKDAPSGTALWLAGAIAQAWNTPLDAILRTNDPGERPGQVNTVSRREGEVVGEHIVEFRNGTDVIRHTHTAAARSIYAEGALEAAAWLTRRPAGLYTAGDWLAAE